MSDVLIRFVHISDTHITPNDRKEMRKDHYSERVLKMIEEMSASRTSMPHVEPPVANSVANRLLVDQINKLPFMPDFVLHTGDIMTDPTADEYTAVKEIFEDLKCPIHYVPGNHDDVAGVQEVLVGAEEAKPTYDYEFDLNGVQVVCVDSASNGEDHGGRLSAEQLQWLGNICSAEDSRPLIVAIHHPVRTLGLKMLDFFNTVNGDEVHEVLKKAGMRLLGVFSGHIHQAIDVVDEGVHYSFVQASHTQSNLFPALDGADISEPLTPNPGFSVVTVTSERLFIRRFTYDYSTVMADAVIA